MIYRGWMIINKQSEVQAALDNIENNNVFEIPEDKIFVWDDKITLHARSSLTRVVRLFI